VNLKEINEAIDKLTAAGIEVVAVSADGIVATKALSERLGGLKFPLATGLSAPQMRTLGLYISEPTNYIEQTFIFAEPAFFFLNGDNTIRYISVANNPVAGRVNVDHLLMANSYVQGRLKTDPAFASVVWGSVL
jgi:peroxiredoxin